MKQLFMYVLALLIMGLMCFVPNQTQGAKAYAGKPILPVCTTSVKDSVIPTMVPFTTQPLYFIPNQGQVDQRVNFYARTSYYTLWLTKKALVFDSGDSQQREKRVVTRLTFPGARHNPVLTAHQPSNHRVNILLGNNPNTWKTNIPGSKAVLYENLYPNINLKVYGMEKKIEYDWQINPGANPNSIRLLFSGVLHTNLNKEGNLIVHTALGDFIHYKPIAYQTIKGEKKQVPVNYFKQGTNLYSFDIGAYDQDIPLVIDPVVAMFSTLFGGSGTEQSIAVALDSYGNPFITGITASIDFPTSDGLLNSHHGGMNDVFITNFSGAGDALVFSTYLGGNGNDTAESIKISTNGQIYISGSTNSTDFPLKNPYKSTYGGGSYDAYVTILGAHGNTIIASTYLGGYAEDKAFGLALDNNRNVYICGTTTSSNFPVLNAFQSSHNGSPNDAFVTKFNPTLSGLLYSTYLGGSGVDTAFDIAVVNNQAYVAGRSYSSDFPVLNEYQAVHAFRYSDAFVTKFSASGNTLIYSTGLGGFYDDSAYAIAVDANGYADVVGETYSDDFPLYEAIQGQTLGTGYVKDAFFTRIAPGGVWLTCSTYLGGSEDDVAYHVEVNSAGNIYITGTTASSNFPLERPYQASLHGGNDAFVVMLTQGGRALSFSTYLGGAYNDYGRGITVDSTGNAFITGETNSVDFPLLHPYQNSLSGGLDTFLTKLYTAELGTLGGGVDNCNLTWTTGGNQKWFEEPEIYFFDHDAVQTKYLTYNQSSYIQTTVNGPGQLSFYWLINSMDTSTLTVYLDNQSKYSMHGGYLNETWIQKSLSIPEGAHTIKWEYYRGHIDEGSENTAFLDKVEYIANIPLTFNREQLTFGAIRGTFVPGQTVLIHNSSPASMLWSLSVDKTWLACSPPAGANDRVVSVNVSTYGLAVGTYTSTITLTATNATGSKTLPVTLNVLEPDSSAVPFGTFDTPSDGATITSSVPFTGWVLDDIGVVDVKLYRHENGLLYYIGLATFVEGARPDVETAFPNYPNNYKAGWGYMMLTNFLPNGGNGTYVIDALATDRDGHQVTLGSKTVYIDNAHAVKPFGAIDTPVQGGSASGAGYVNYGWVLTPQPNMIPINGSTIEVWVDGLMLGHPVYNQYRYDIASAFPGYANSNGAVGYFYLNTTPFANGIHTIQWTAQDNAGNSDGIGSRYFMIENNVTDVSEQSNKATQEERLQLKSFIPNTASAVFIQKGFNTRDGNGTAYYPDEQGKIKIKIKELEPIQFSFTGTGLWVGKLVKNGQLSSLPIGSVFNSRKGTFTWQPGPGFLGKFSLVFAQKNSAGQWLAQTIDVIIVPKY